MERMKYIGKIIDNLDGDAQLVTGEYYKCYPVPEATQKYGGNLLKYCKIYPSKGQCPFIVPKKKFE